MPGKRLTDAYDRSKRSMDIRAAFRRGSRQFWVRAGQVILLGILLVVGIIGAQTDILMVTLIAGALSFLLLMPVLPMERVEEGADYLWSGDAGEDAHETTTDILNRVRRK